MLCHKFIGTIGRYCTRTRSLCDSGGAETWLAQRSWERRLAACCNGWDFEMRCEAKWIEGPGRKWVWDGTGVWSPRCAKPCWSRKMLLIGRRRDHGCL